MRTLFTALLLSVTALCHANFATPAGFGPFDISGQRRTHWVDGYRAPSPASGDVVLRNPTNEGNLVRYCGCSARAIDGQVASSEGLDSCWNSNSSPRLLAKAWVYGQFIAHELVATTEQPNCDPTVLPIEPEYPFAPQEMFMCPLVGPSEGGCPAPVNTMRPGITGDVIYSPDESYMQNVLRLPGTCMLRTGPGNTLPTASYPGGNVTWVTGDLRVDQHCSLMGVHTVFMREHNRLCAFMNQDAMFSGLDVDEKFLRAKNVVVAKLQQLTLEWLEEWGITQDNMCEGIVPPADATVSVEFSTVAMRIGHAIIGDTAGGRAMYDTFGCDKIHNLREGVEATFQGEDIATFWIKGLQSSPIYEADGKGTRVMCLHEFGQHVSENQIVKNCFRNQDMQMPTYGELAECMGVAPNPSVPAGEIAFVGALSETAGKPVGKENGLGNLNMAILKKQFCGIFNSGPVWWNDPSSVDGFEQEILETTVTTLEDANTNVHQGEGIGFSRKDGGRGPAKFTGFKVPVSEPPSTAAAPAATPTAPQAAVTTEPATAPTTSPLAPIPTPAAGAAGGECGGDGQAVCPAGIIPGNFECKFGYIGVAGATGRVCEPYGNPTADDCPTTCGKDGQPVCTGRATECCHGFVGEEAGGQRMCVVYAA